MTEKSLDIKPVVESWNYAIYEKDNKIFFVNYGIGEFYIAVFALILLLVIFSINGFVQLFFYPKAAIILLWLAVLSAFALNSIVKSIKEIKEEPFSEKTLTGIIDLDAGTLLDERGEVQALLSDVVIENVLLHFQFPWWFQPALVAKWPNDGCLTLIHGNGFFGWPSMFCYYLKKKWLMK